jgi:hypothetical protein
MARRINGLYAFKKKENTSLNGNGNNIKFWRYLLMYFLSIYYCYQITCCVPRHSGERGVCNSLATMNFKIKKIPKQKLFGRMINI